MRELAVGGRAHVITWLHLADRSVLRVHPRDDETQPMRGIFDTRSQGSAQPARTAHRHHPRDRSDPGAGERSRSRRRHPGARRQASAEGGARRTGLAFGAVAETGDLVGDLLWLGVVGGHLFEPGVILITLGHQLDYPPLWIVDLQERAVLT
jgi:hypothetical protein